MSKYTKCDECNGTGVVLFHTNEGPYNREFNGDCPECDGTGEIKSIKYLDDDNDDDI